MSRTHRAHAGMRLLARRLHVSELPAPLVRVERNMPIPMRDGAVLRADRWLPVDGDDAPVVLIRTPYGRGGLFGVLFGRLFAHQGFQVLLQSCRGTAGSGGVFDRPFSCEVDDGHDTVAWLRSQSWYPGTFATAGGSYFGYTQLALADAAPGEHVAAILAATPLSTRDVAWPDGTFSPGVALRWAAQAGGDPAAALRNTLSAGALDRKLRRAVAKPPLLRTYQVATRRRLPFLEEWLENEDPTSLVWKEQDLSGALDAFRGAVLVQAGWYDIFLDASLRQYAQLRARDIDARLTVGPWTHAGVGLSTVNDSIEFLREVTLGAPPRAAGKRVRLTALGSTREQLLDDWAPAERTLTYCLTAGRLTQSAEPGAAESASRFRYDPGDPTPQLGGPLLDTRGGGGRDNRTLEGRADVVTFDTDPLPERIVIRGGIRVQLEFGSDRPATCVFLRICDVSPDGTSTNLVDRMVPLHDSGTSMWTVDATLPAVAAVVRTGHRLRLQVSSGATPRFLPHPGTTEGPTRARKRFPAQQVIYHGAGHPATVTIPISGEA